MRPALLAPALLFLLVAFILPLGAFLLRSVDNPEVATTLPRTIDALAGWDTGTPVPQAAFAALVTDLREAGDDRQVALLARRLNYVLPGFRSLILKTRVAVTESARGGDPRQLLASVDGRWSDPHPWAAIRNSGARFTAYYFLTALDLKYADDGSIEHVPPDQRLFLNVVGRTFWMSLVVTLLSIALAYPLAHLIATVRPALATLLMFFVLLPFWTSLLVRTSAWVLLLQKEGLLNRLLIATGLTTEPLSLIFNRFGVYVAMTHVLLPFAVLPLYAIMKRIGPTHMRAAVSLGASPFRAFFDVYVPQTYPGLAASAVIVFILSLGYYITPALVGGPDDQMISSFVAFYTNQSINWGLASALGVVLLVLTLAVYLAFRLVFGADRLRVG